MSTAGAIIYQSSFNQTLSFLMVCKFNFKHKDNISQRSEPTPILFDGKHVFLVWVKNSGYKIPLSRPICDDELLGRHNDFLLLKCAVNLRLHPCLFV